MHLKENAQRNLSAQNVPEKVISAIFGSTGLIYSYSRVEYVELELEIKQEFAECGAKYFRGEITINYQRENLFTKIRKQNYSPDWKNNNCESMNHKIKLLGNWKVSKLPELIERLKEIHESQLLEIRAALHGRGNLELSQRA